MRTTDLVTEPNAPLGSIIPYYMQNGDPAVDTMEPWCYNGITKWGTYASIEAASANSDPFKMSTTGEIPRE